MIDQNGSKQENHILHRFYQCHCCLMNLIKNVLIKINN